MTLKVVAVVAYLLFFQFGITFIKLGSAGWQINIAPDAFSVGISWRSAVGLLCYSVSFMIFVWLLRQFQLSTMAPLIAFVCFGVFLISVFVLHEKVTVLQVVGVALIGLGIVFMNIRRSTG
jgi:drug/metabolite transporter (DMT)-like permease